MSGSSCSSTTRGVFATGHSGNPVNSIEYITIQTTGNGTDFGDLTEARNKSSGASSGTRGVFGGGQNTSAAHSNVIDYITIDTTGNATDFGDLTAAKFAFAATAGT